VDISYLKSNKRGVILAEQLKQDSANSQNSLGSVPSNAGYHGTSDSKRPPKSNNNGRPIGGDEASENLDRKNTVSGSAMVDKSEKDDKSEDNKKEEKSEKTAKYVPEFKIKFVKEIPVLPDLTDPSKIDVRYTVIYPYVAIHIHWNEETSEILYDIEEPVLSVKEKEQLALLEDGLTELINISFVNIKDKGTVLEFLEKNLKILIDEFSMKVSHDAFLKFMYYVYRDFLGLNKIEGIMQDYFIEDIECNGVNVPVYIVHRKYKNLKTNVTFTDIKNLTQFVEKLAQRCGQYISYANPLLDGVLPDSGARVNATYTQDISSKGPTFTIRKFTKEPWTPVKLMDFRTVSPEVLSYLWLLVENKASVMVIGGTGAGKTSFLNALAFFIPPAARIVSIEDTPELNLKHENWLPSVARQGVGGEGRLHGEVSLFDLLKESLRQRPDYIIVGEIRGKEAYVLFQAMATGHPSYGTMHAEDVKTMIERLKTPPINLPPSLVESLDAACVMIQTRIGKKPVRRLREVTEIIRVGQTLRELVTNTPFIRDPATDKFLFKTDSKVLLKIMERTGMTWPQLLAEFKRRTKLLMELYRRKIFGFEEVQKVIHEYYKKPDEVLRRFGIK